MREVNTRVFGKGLKLLSVNAGMFEIKQLLFADDITLVADSEEKLCRLMSEVGKVYKRRKLRVKLGKSKVMRCTRYRNGGRMHMRLKEVNCVLVLGVASGSAVDAVCERDVGHRMNEE